VGVPAPLDDDLIQDERLQEFGPPTATTSPKCRPEQGKKQQQTESTDVTTPDTHAGHTSLATDIITQHYYDTLSLPSSNTLEAALEIGDPGPHELHPPSNHQEVDTSLPSLPSSFPPSPLFLITRVSEGRWTATQQQQQEQGQGSGLVVVVPFVGEERGPDSKQAPSDPVLACCAGTLGILGVPSCRKHGTLGAEVRREENVCLARANDMELIWNRRIMISLRTSYRLAILQVVLRLCRKR
jgi:hypothetical protein